MLCAGIRVCGFALSVCVYVCVQGLFVSRSFCVCTHTCVCVCMCVCGGFWVNVCVCVCVCASVCIRQRGDRKLTPCSNSNLYKSFPSFNRVHSSDSAFCLPGAGLICSTSSQRNEPNLHVQLLSGPGPAAGSDGQRRLQPGAVAVDGEGDYVDQG